MLLSSVDPQGEKIHTVHNTQSDFWQQIYLIKMPDTDEEKKQKQKACVWSDCNRKNTLDHQDSNVKLRWYPLSGAFIWMTGIRQNLFVCQARGEGGFASVVWVNLHCSVECGSDSVLEGKMELLLNMNENDLCLDEYHCGWLAQSEVIIIHLERSCKGDSLKGTMSHWYLLIDRD